MDLAHRHAHAVRAVDVDLVAAGRRPVWCGETHNAPFAGMTRIRFQRSVLAAVGCARLEPSQSAYPRGGLPCSASFRHPACDAWRKRGSSSRTSSGHMTDTTTLNDTRARPLRDLRISVTDRCNFRCTYCMPKEVFGRDFHFLPAGEILSFEEIARLARIFAELGVRKVRLTGGEPLLRRDLTTLIAMLAEIEGIEDLTLTTNGSLLAKLAPALKSAGLARLTISLDSLDDAVFRAMNDVDFPVQRVLDGIDAAAEAGLGPVKINVVVKRGINEESILPLAAHFRGSGHIVRFIEYMDVGTTNGWRLDDVVTAAEIARTIDAAYPIEPVAASYRGEVANRYRYKDGRGEFGIIASVTQPFCGDCTRARLSSEGQLYTCLFAARGHDLRALLRDGASNADIARFIADIWRVRDDRYSELRTAQTADVPKVEMSHIGG